MPRHQQHEEPENHERWMVSYADFVTLLFAFFVVMYAISSVNEGKYKVLSSSLTTAFREGTSTPLHMPPNGAPTDALVTLNHPKINMTSVKSETALDQKKKEENLKQQLATALQPLDTKTGKVRITSSPQGITIEISDTSLFESGQARPSHNAILALRDVGILLSKQQGGVRVEGFTDDVPIHTAIYPSNWELSAARAGTIVRLLEKNGVDPTRLVAIGHGATKPIVSNDTAEGRARNRRVTISLLTIPKDETLPAPNSPPPMELH